MNRLQIPWPAGLLSLGLVCCLASTVLAAPVRVEFRFQHETAATVNLAGTFNGWNTGSDPMSGPDPDHWWTLEMLLDPGDYEYKFVVDGGQWFADPLNPRINYSNYGNSMLEVTDPLVYYLLPMDGTEIATPLPEVRANLAKSDSRSFNLDELKIFLDGIVVAQGASYFDPVTQRVSFTPADTLDSGPHGVKVRIALMTGVSDSDTSAFELDADLVPPVIVHVAPAVASANAEVQVECTITDNVSVEQATLYYRNAGDPAYETTAMLGGLDDLWVATVPSGFTVAGVDLEYYIEAEDRAHTAKSPSAGTHTVPISPDEDPPVVSEAFVSPATFSPTGTDNEARLSFRLSEPATVTVDVRTTGGAPVKTLISSSALGAGYHQAVWDGRDGGGSAVSDADYRFHVNGMDGAGLSAPEAQVPVGVDRSSDPGPIQVILLFHANQTLNYQGDTANDVCFWGLLDVLRRHPQSKFMLHFSGTLLHDLGWFNFRHEPSTIDMLRAGVADGQFEIVGSTYAQNIPYSTHMWDNDRQVEVQREVIETMLGADPVSFWNAERCWTQGLVPLLTRNDYNATWVESHILWDSGTTWPEHSVRKTRLGSDDVVVFNDDGDFIGKINWAIDSGNTGDPIGYLDWLRSEDTYRNWVVCYADDAEATGLWDYEGGNDPQSNWDNLDQLLTDMENTGWIKLTTFSEYLADHYPTEEVTPIVDGQANWMVGPSQSAGYADWFDYNERSPLLADYRDVYTGLRTRIQGVEAQVSPGTPAAGLVKHAIWNLTAHQFEFGCIGCGSPGCQDYQKAETLEGALLAAETCLTPPVGTTVTHEDANGDTLADWVIRTPTDFYIVSDTGGRLLRWFDLVRGEEVLGNEFFMWGFYYWGYRHWWAGGGYNDDQHYMVDTVWDAPTLVPAAQPYHRTYGIRKHAFNDRLSVDGGDDTLILDADYTAEVREDTLRLVHSRSGLDVVKSWIAIDSELTVVYELTNTNGQSHDYVLTLENALNPSLLEVMNGGRGTLVYWDGSDTSSVLTPSAVGVMNVRTERGVAFEFSEAPVDLTGGETVHGILFSPSFEFTLDAGQTKTIRVTVGVNTTTASLGEEIFEPRRFRLHQNYPNPFNPVTHIAFDLPSEERVRLDIFDIRGRKIARLLDEDTAPGSHSVTWEGRDEDGLPVATGVYLCRMEAGDQVQTKKLLLLK